MAFCIEKDMGKGNPPAFLSALSDDGMPTWSTMESAKQYDTETDAQTVIDSNDALMGCITQEYGEVVDLTTDINPILKEAHDPKAV